MIIVEFFVGGCGEENEAVWLHESFVAVDCGRVGERFSRYNPREVNSDAKCIGVRPFLELSLDGCQCFEELGLAQFQGGHQFLGSKGRYALKERVRGIQIVFSRVGHGRLQGVALHYGCEVCWRDKQVWFRLQEGSCDRCSQKLLVFENFNQILDGAENKVLFYLLHLAGYA